MTPGVGADRAGAGPIEPAGGPAVRAAGPRVAALAVPVRTVRGPSRSVGTAAILLLVPLFAAAQPAAPPSPGAPEAALVRTVLDQLTAFARGDWVGAYAFAAELIRQRLSLRAFREMVVGGYAPIARPAGSAVLRALTVDADHGLVEVRVAGQDGETIDALYELVREGGQWRVNGVLARPAERPGVWPVATEAGPGRPAGG